MHFKWKQGLTALAVAVSMTAGSASAWAAAGNETIPAWVSAEVASWQQLGLLKGDANGSVLPNQAVNRAEFAAFVNRVFNYQTTSPGGFSDVPASAWYASDIGKAVAAGALVGSNGQVDPLGALTREQAALILYRVFKVSPAAASSSFTDDAAISSWAKEAVYSMRANGYLEGTPDGAFQPKKTVTRAEAIKMINNAMGALIADGSSHAGLSGGNLVVNTAGGDLSGLNLTGNLYITPGVGEGDLTISDSAIAGTVFVSGGGIHSITFSDTQAGGIVVDKDSPVHVILSGNSTAGTVNVDSEGSLLDVNEGSQVDSLTMNSGGTVSGEGTVQNATVNAPGVSFSKAPGKLTLNASQTTVEGKTVTKETDETGSESGSGSTSGGSTGGGNTGGGSDGGGTVTPKETEVFTYEEVLTQFSSTGNEGLAKRYIEFLSDSTYTPSIASPDAALPDLTNAITFVDKDFTIKPSIFASLRGVNTSVLTDDRSTLWIGTDTGVAKITLATGATVDYVSVDGQLADDKVLLLILDGNTGVYAITATGVSHIYQ
ncbi:S-layer homology domain-containing protein [Cohnella fermenti]|uniref:S-layer homology domain-containing protein n=1 Tax=Cohnella fermenti TaxID=2565925 RepID=A0A4V3WGH3_9BACL|nr:S-layer homology domain-containing protein [Cohnella fermenti]THF84229.1 S-layer homology domain-containing protein [Cohnella fermenti]